MKTFQNRGEGFDVGEELGRLPSSNEARDQSAELVNRCHMRRDAVDISILFVHKELEHRLEWLIRIICRCVVFHSLEDLEEFWCCKLLSCFLVVVENPSQRFRDRLHRTRVVRERNDEGEGFNDGK